jgi:hypothetical protein
MDPQTTWDALLESLAAREWDRIDELARALLAWLDSGGFPPKTLGRDDLGSDFNRDLAVHACFLALARARPRRSKRRRQDA